jgi:hypothetical protein
VNLVENEPLASGGISGSAVAPSTPDPASGCPSKTRSAANPARPEVHPQCAPLRVTVVPTGPVAGQT